MKINIKATNIDLSDSIRDYLDKKLEGLEIFVDSDHAEAIAQVELGKTSNHHKSGDIFRAEINITMAGKHVRAVSETADLYSSIDDMKDEIFQDVKKEKTRKRSLVRRGRQRMKDMMKGIWKKGKK